MRVLVDIGHPAHVHLFRHCAANLVEKGHEVKFTARDKESALYLLKFFGMDYEIRGDLKSGMLDKAVSMFSTDHRIYKIAKSFRPDLFVGVHNPYIAQVAKLLRKKSITFTDTEYVGIASRLTFPFTDTICTPSCFLEELDPRKHVRYNGFHELAYLHPNYFKPDQGVLDELGLSKKEDYIILRFISWAASHDVGLKGIGKAADLVKSLEDFGRVLVTSEGKLGSKLEKYRISCSPEKIHSLMYYAQLYLGEGGTMAAESALLGTPAIHVEANAEGVATGSFSGNFLELRDKYGLLYFYPDQGQAFSKAVEILENPDSKKEWQRKREKLLGDKIDVSAWMTEFIENYPVSFHEYKKSLGTV